MRRSEVNALIRDAEALFARHGFVPPPWSRFAPADWAARPEVARHCAERQMGWDVTDFGSGDFARRGLLLLCTRNGLAGRPGERAYAEKAMVVREGQETPFHTHHVKVEDIVNRGGAALVVEVTAVEGGRETGGALDLLVDGAVRRVASREPVVLAPGESVTLFPGQWHRFYGRGGTVLAGEVSLTNDDRRDNAFLEPVGRFAAIVEDAAPWRPLWSELDGPAEADAGRVPRSRRPPGGGPPSPPGSGPSPSAGPVRSGHAPDGSRSGGTGR